MAELSLQERLVRYLKARPGQWTAKGTIADLARDKMGVTGESVGRRLRILHEASGMSALIASRTSPEHVRALELLEGGAVLVDHREKNHAHYCYQPPEYRQVQVREVVIEGGVAKEVIRTVTV